MNKYGSRKFILALVTLTCCTWLLHEGLLTSGDFKTVIIGVVGLYMGGNVAQGALAAKGGTNAG